MKGKNKWESVDMCTSNNMAITKTADKIKEGWEGKVKELLQVVWERVVIDGTDIKQYSLTGKKDEFGFLFAMKQA